MKLWGGRFKSGPSEKLDSFNSSLPFDIELYQYDIAGSRAHVKMLAEVDIISKEEKETILSGLNQVEVKITDTMKAKKGVPFQAEDIHSLVEELLTEEIGEAAGKLHTGRSRNDQVALDIKLYLKDNSDEIADLLLEVIKTLITLAEQEKDTIMPGYTHMQAAQPITLAHHLLAYAWKLKRDYEKLQDCIDRHNFSPLGAGALAGSTFPLDREMTAKELEFTGPTANSLDSVSDRDFVLDFQGTAVNIMLHLSSLAEEIIFWNSQEVGFIEIDDEMSTGSSIMPQKKNPDVAELIRGKTGRVLGNQAGLAMTLKGLPLAYNKDLQEDKEGLFDTVKTLQEVLEILPDFLEAISFQRDKMAQAASRGFLNATEIADYLADKGVAFRRAHEIAGKIVNTAVENKIKLEELNLASLNNFVEDEKVKFEEDIYDWLDLKNAIARRDIYGGPAPKRTTEQIEKLTKWLESEA
ncbi:MAG: argininosuccinate lyase [Bacillota bacterium]